MCKKDVMLRKLALRCYPSTLFYRHILMHRHSHSYLSVKQALETIPSGSIPVLIQVGDLTVHYCSLSSKAG